MFQRTLPLMVFPAVKLVLHLVTHRGYGMFRDEYYYLACAERLAWGYVDHPPFSIFLLWIVRNLLGDSLLAVRLLPALAGAATVLLVGLMARRLGGGLFAQSLAMVGALAAPIYLALDHFYSMNAFDLVFWALAAYLILLLVQGAGVRVWLLLGAVLGLGLMNKISILWLGFGLLVGLLVTQRRRWLLTPGPWLAAGLAVLLFLPYILWQVGNDWPTVEFIRNASGQKMLEVKPLDFMLSQLRVMNPAVAPLWL
ncbi:MAG: phospholipid carrier-dependent glycosyltransferase, partial [Acidobacteria bacterium]